MESWQPHFYKLVGREVERVADQQTWLDWFATHFAETRIRQEQIGNFFVSTIFIGIDSAHSLGLTPLLFETAICGHTGWSSDRK